MKNIFYIIILFGFLSACNTEENDFEKVLLPNSDIAGEYDVNFDITQPDPQSGHATLIITNTAANNDSLWIEDGDFFESKVKVKRTGNKFSVSNGADIIYDEVVNIEGEIFPGKDSIHVEWRYLRGDPADDFVIIGNGVLFNGLTN